jgi:predicted DNA-binding WGR domain protein
MDNTTRHFEFKDDKSSKFWEITQSGDTVMVRYGKTGTTGQSQIKAFSDATVVGKHAQKLIAEKLGKGYVEQGAVASDAPVAAGPTTETSKTPKAASASSSVAKLAKPVSAKQDPAAVAKYLESTPEQLAQVVGINETIDRLLAKHLKASPQLLEKLSHSSDKTARRNVALNANTDKAVLLKLAPQFPGEFFKNPVFDWLLLEEPDLVTNLGHGVLKNILKRKDCPASFMKWALERGSEQERLAVAMNPETPKELLHMLVEQGGSIAEAAACHQRLQQTTGTIDWEGAFKNGVAQAIMSVPRSEVGRLLGKGQISEAQWPALDPICRLELRNTGPVSLALMLLAEGRGDRWIESLAGRRLFASCEGPFAEEVYVILARDTDFEVRKSLLRNLDVSDAIKVGLLREMATDASSEVRTIVAEHKLCPPELLFFLAEDDDESVTSKVVAHPKVSAETRTEVLSSFATSKESYFRGIAAGDTNCPPSLLEKLAQDKDDYVRSKVAANRMCLQTVLEKLAADKKVDVRVDVAGNPNCPTICFELLAGDLSRQTYGPSVQEALAKNPVCPANVLERLAFSKLSDVRKLVAQNPNGSCETLQLLAADPDIYVREALTGNGSVSTETINILSRDSKSSVRSKLGRRAGLSLQVFERLAADDEGWVRRTIASNPDCPEFVLSLLAEDKDPEVRFEVTKNGACLPLLRARLLIELALTWTDSYHHSEIMAKAQLSKEDLVKLSRHKLAGVRLAVASRPDCPQECLIRFANDKSPSVVDAVAGNVECPDEILRQFIERGTALRTVAVNCACPIDALPSLWSKLLELDYCWTVDAVHEALFSKHQDKRSFQIPESFVDLIKKECEDFLETPLNSIAWKQIQASCKDEATRRACAAGDLLFITEDNAESACNNKEMVVRLLGLSHRKASPAVLAKYSKSVHWVERMGIARNPNTPPNIIDSLCRDSNLLVAQQASQTIGVKAETAQRQTNAIQSSDDTVDLNPIVAEVRKRLAKAHDVSDLSARNAFRELCNSRWDTSFPLKYWLDWGTAMHQLSPVSVDQGLRVSAKTLTSLELDKVHAMFGDVALLSRLTSSSDKEVRRLVASNANASAETLAQLAKDRSPEVREAVIKNPSTPEAVLLKIAASKDRSVRRTLAESSAHASVLEVLAADSDSWVVETVAANPSIPVELFRKLAATNKKLHIELAGNSAAPQDLLRQWATKSTNNVRSAVAENKATPPEILLFLVDDMSVDVMTVLCNDARLQSEQRVSVMRRLAECKSLDEYPHCFRLAKCFDLPMDLIDKVLGDCVKAAQDRYGKYQFKDVAKQSSSRTVLEKLSVNPDSEIRIGVAENVNTPPHVLGMLASDSDQSIRLTVAENANASLHALKMLAADADPGIRCAVAGNAASPKEVLALIEGDFEISVRMAVASNPNAPAECLLKLSKDAHLGVRERVSNNPTAPIDVRVSLLDDLLDQYLSDPAEYLGQSIVNNSALTPAMLDALVANAPSGTMLMGTYGHKVATSMQVLTWAANPKAHPVLRLISACNPNYPDGERCKTIEALVNHIIEVAEQPLESLEDITRAEIVLALKALEVYSDDMDKKATAAAAKSRDWLERVAATLSPATQLSLLKMLVEDEAEVVKRLAIDRLKKLESSKQSIGLAVP